MSFPNKTQPTPGNHLAKNLPATFVYTTRTPDLLATIVGNLTGDCTVIIFGRYFEKTDVPGDEPGVTNLLSQG